MSLVRWQATIVNESGDVQVSASVDIRNSITGALVSVASDEAGTPKGNPFIADSNGFAFGYIPGGNYDITASLGAFSITWSDVPVFGQNSAALYIDSATLFAGLSFDAEQVVSTRGYTTVGDQGAATYIIVSAGDFGGTPDGFGDHFIGNGNVAVLKRDANTSIQQFGATSAISTAAIQAAFTSGGVINANNGEFGFDDQLTFPTSGTVLRGNGTFKLAAGVYALESTVRIMPSVTDCAFSGITWDFNRANTTGSSGTGFAGSNNVNDIDVVNMTVTGCPKRSFTTNNDLDVDPTQIPALNTAKRWKILGLKVMDSGDKCAQARLSEDIQFTNCFAQTSPTDLADPSDSAFEASRSYNVTFINCTGEHLVALSGPGFRAVNGCRDVSFIGGSTTGGRQGLFASDVSGVKFIGITVRETGFEGAIIAASRASGVGYEVTDDVKILGCTFIDCDDTGAICDISGSATDLTNINICGNTFINSAGGPMTTGILQQALTGNVSVYESGNIYDNVASPTSGPFKSLLNTNTDRITSTEAATLKMSTESGTHLELGGSATVANRVLINGQVAGAPPAISSIGSDTNIDIRFVPKGTGKLRYGTHSALAAETLSGYIEIKDTSGNVRKLAVVS